MKKYYLKEKVNNSPEHPSPEYDFIYVAAESAAEARKITGLSVKKFRCYRVSNHEFIQGRRRGLTIQHFSY